jgi:hypothetical protein
MPERGQAVQPQTGFVSVKGALGEVADVDPMLLIAEPFARDLGEPEGAAARARGG